MGNILSIALIFFLAGNTLTPAQRSIEAEKKVAVSKGKRENIYISEVLNNGAILELSDGSIWKVSLEDTEFTSAWLGPAPVKITKSLTPNKKFSYTMKNMWTNKTVRVERVSQ